MQVNVRTFIVYIHICNPYLRSHSISLTSNADIMCLVRWSAEHKHIFLTYN
jgi:hypothetical protein